jgi:acyl-CoA reductase-like NAD-dependent aldehyde dehydrogenase
MTISVKKTYKLFVGGKFPRSESGRSYQPETQPQTNVTRGSRKDLRDAVVAAQKGWAAWSGAATYLRGQILYRLGEMMESRRDALVAELVQSGRGKAAAAKEVTQSVSLVTWYAGLPDKLQTLLGSQNAVQGPFFNFSTIESVGTIGVLAPEEPSLLGLMALVLPVLAGGNSVVALVSERAPFAALTMGEVFATSDFPAGSVNLLAGSRSELAPHFASHRGIDGLLVAGAPDARLTAAAADNLKRVRYCNLSDKDWRSLDRLRSVYWVEPFVEVKTLWHPVAQ